MAERKSPQIAVSSKYFLTAVLAVLLIPQGCERPFARPQTATERAAWGKPRWGPPAEGLQLRLHADRRTWQPGQRPSFSFDLRNRGKRTFVFWPAQKLALSQIEFDGKWYRWPEPLKIDSLVWPLAPGAQYNSVTIELDRRFGIELEPGKHILRLAFTLEGVRVVSNPVGIEIRRPNR